MKEEESSFTDKKVKGNAKAIAAAEAERQLSEKKYSKVEIAAEMTCAGHPPIKPALKYMQRDPAVQGLIALRMDELSPIDHHSLTLKMSTSCGMKEIDAAKIDAVLKGLKVTAKTSLTSEAQKESHRLLEYEIDF